MEIGFNTISFKKIRFSKYVNKTNTKLTTGASNILQT